MMTWRFFFPKRKFCLPQISQMITDFSLENHLNSSVKTCVICGKMNDDTASTIQRSPAVQRLQGNWINGT
jgi:hypothetical protein